MSKSESWIHSASQNTSVMSDLQPLQSLPSCVNLPNFNHNLSGSPWPQHARPEQSDVPDPRWIGGGPAVPAVTLVARVIWPIEEGGIRRNKRGHETFIQDYWRHLLRTTGDDFQQNPDSNNTSWDVTSNDLILTSKDADNGKKDWCSEKRICEWTIVNNNRC